MKTYIEMLIGKMVYERLGNLEKLKLYSTPINEKYFLKQCDFDLMKGNIDLMKEKIEKYNLEGASETNIQEFIKKVSLIEYYKIIGDFNAAKKIESELKALKRQIRIELILQK